MKIWEKQSKMLIFWEGVKQPKKKPLVDLELQLSLLAEKFGFLRPKTGS